MMGKSRRQLKVNQMIKIKFCDFWPGFERNNLFLDLFLKSLPVKIDNNPEYLICSVYGYEHLKYDNAIKILFTGENLVPDFNLYDYALGFHYFDFGDRYMRYPLYAYYQSYFQFYGNQVIKDTLVNNNNLETLAHRKFCNFIYSNNVNSDPLRDNFFNELSKYKKIDSGGRHLNNIGEPIKNKLAFIKDYKFTIAFENSSVPGYTTEKLVEPILVNSLPIYYGNPLVHLDFDPDSFVYLKDKFDIHGTISRIIELDNDDEKYISKLHKIKFADSNTIDEWEKKIVSFFENIFIQPQSESCRRPKYGFTRYYFDELKLQNQLLERKRSYSRFKWSIKKLVSSIPSSKKN